MAALEQITGTVSKVNGTGFKLAERDGYLNISKFADPPPSMPETGQRVTVGLDPSGFVRTIAAVGPGAAPLQVPAPVSIAALNRETTITRLTCVKAAAVFAASRPDMKSPDLLTLAERLEAWVTR